MITFKPFTKQDWYGLSGAEGFEDGSEPLVAYFTILVGELETAATAVVDQNGLTIESYDDEGAVHLLVTWEGAFAARALAALHDRANAVALTTSPGVTVHAGFTAPEALVG